jgi:hypothetical protein
MIKKMIIPFFIVAIISSGLAQDGTSRLQTHLKKYFNTTVEKVKMAESPDQQRQILNDSMHKLVMVLNTIQNRSDIPAQDLPAVNKLKKQFQQKIDELNGRNGFNRVTDGNLLDFATYVQQDMEQADRYVTLSLTTVLLIIIILLLI